MAEAFGIPCHELVSLDFRCGSGADERGHRQEGLLLEVKRTKSARKRTSALDGLLSGATRMYRRHGPDFRV